MARKIVGIDIGESEVKFAVYSKRKITLLSEKLPDNLVREGRIMMPETMSQFLRTSFKKLHIRYNKCAVALPDSMSFYRRIAMPMMTEAQLKLNLPYEFKDFVVGDGNKYYYDYAVEGYTEDEAGKKTEIRLFAAASLKTTIEKYQDVFDKAKLKLVAAIPTEAAYINMMRRYIANNPDAANREICIADVGSSRTTIHIFKGAIQQAIRNVDIGSSAIDAAIAGALVTDVYIARSHKETNYNNSRSLLPCIDVYNRIAVEVLKAVNFYRFSNPDCELNTLYIAGGGAEITELVSVVSNTTSLTVTPITELYPDNAKGECAQRAQIAIGTVLQ